MRDIELSAVWAGMNKSTRTPELVFPDLAYESLAVRLGRQLRHSAAELRSDPVAYLRSLVEGDTVDRQRRRILWAIRLGLPTATAGGFVLGILLHLSLFGRPVVDAAGPAEDEPLRVASFVTAEAQPAPESSTSRPGGGGGGGRNSHPVSKGVIPPSSLVAPIVPATTKPIPPPPDPLPMPPPLLAPPVPVDPGIFGDPLSSSTEPSDGPGEDGGAGNGENGGWGNGDGPGKVDGTHGGPGGPSRDPSGAARRNQSTAVAVRARILNTPHPSYTEEARTNRTEGTVRVQVTLGADGRVRNARVVAGLPHGLNECALKAVNSIRFEPARDSGGRSVDSTMTVFVQFAIR